MMCHLRQSLRFELLTAKNSFPPVDIFSDQSTFVNLPNIIEVFDSLRNTSTNILCGSSWI